MAEAHAGVQGVEGHTPGFRGINARVQGVEGHTPPGKLYSIPGRSTVSSLVHYIKRIRPPCPFPLNPIVCPSWPEPGMAPHLLNHTQGKGSGEHTPGSKRGSVQTRTSPFRVQRGCSVRVWMARQ